MSGESFSPKPPDSTSSDGSVDNSRRMSAAKLFKRLSKGQGMSETGIGDGKKAMEGALRSLNEPRKTIDGTLKALKRMSISQDRSSGRSSPSGSSDVNEQGNKKLAQAFRKLGKAQIGLSSLM